MFQTVAAGFVADELPKNLVDKFLAAIEKQHDDVYGMDIDDNLEDVTNKTFDKKRTYTEMSSSNDK